MVQQGRPQTTIQYSAENTRFAFRITEAANTQSEYAMHIALPRQQWLRERAQMLHL
jgi:hypothetical protein